MATDLSTTYLGLALANPLVASACPLTGSIDSLLRLEDAGVSAVVLPSLFEEQIEHDELELHQLFEYQAESFAESLSYFPENNFQGIGPERAWSGSRGQGEALDPRHRQPQRPLRRGAGPATPSGCRTPAPTRWS